MIKSSYSYTRSPLIEYTPSILVVLKKINCNWVMKFTQAKTDHGPFDKMDLDSRYALYFEKDKTVQSVTVGAWKLEAKGTRSTARTQHIREKTQSEREMLARRLVSLFNKSSSASQFSRFKFILFLFKTPDFWSNSNSHLNSSCYSNGSFFSFNNNYYGLNPFRSFVVLRSYICDLLLQFGKDCGWREELVWS